MDWTPTWDMFRTLPHELIDILQYPCDALSILCVVHLIVKARMPLGMIRGERLPFKHTRICQALKTVGAAMYIKDIATKMTFCDCTINEYGPRLRCRVLSSS